MLYLYGRCFDEVCFHVETSRVGSEAASGGSPLASFGIGRAS